jgi:hypothetical protein
MSKIKKYIVTSNESITYYKIVEAKNKRGALKKCQLYDPDNEWKTDYKDTQVINQEVEEYNYE